MKKLTLLIITLTLTVGCASTNQTNKSLTQEEIKKWKTEAKSYKQNPADLKSLVESENRLSSEADSLQSLIENLQNQLAQERKSGLSMKQDVNVAKKKTIQYENQLAELTNDLAKYRDLETNCPEKMVSSLVYRVQVGAYRKRDMSSQFNKNVNFGGETEDGLQKYTIGQFRVKKDASQFKNQLVAIGLVDAWIVTYQDGKRISSTKPKTP